MNDMSKRPRSAVSERDPTSPDVPTHITPDRSPAEEVIEESGGEKVGYGNPPKKYRFKKGQSGNPSGRPKDSLNRQTVLIQSLNEIALAEAQRVIAVGEGNDIVLMPVLQGVVRAIADKALKGDAVCTKLLLQIISSAEKEKKELESGLLTCLLDYKDTCEEEFARCDARGQPRFEPLPHPDDILFDPKTGKAKIVGPVCKEEKKEIDRLVANRDTAIGLLENPDQLENQSLESQRKIRAKLIEDIDKINAQLPPRLRRTYRRHCENH